MHLDAFANALENKWKMVDAVFASEFDRSKVLLFDHPLVPGLDDRVFVLEQYLRDAFHRHGDVCRFRVLQMFADGLYHRPNVLGFGDVVDDQAPDSLESSLKIWVAGKDESDHVRLHAP